MTRKTAVARAEAKLGVELPEEYAAFMRQGGPSGEGTVLTLEQALAHGSLRVDLPFPFTQQDATQILRTRAEGNEVFLEPEDSIGGVLPIADAGCNDLTYLVLTGPLRGTVWFGGEPGWLPHARDDGTLLRFDAWYREIADEPPVAKKKAAKKKASKAKAPLVIDRNLYQLNLRGQKLTALPPEVGEMTQVAMVYLGGNALTELPPPLLPVADKLNSLELGPNPIGRIEDEAIARFTKLSRLDLKETKLTRLPDTLDRLVVRELALDRNPQLDLEQAFRVLARMPALRWLSLRGCALTRFPRGALALTQLERLYLGDNEITELPTDFDLKLELLGLIDNRIETIPDAVEKHVQNLYFGGNPGARREKKRFDAVRRGFVML